MYLMTMSCIYFNSWQMLTQRNRLQDLPRAPASYKSYQRPSSICDPQNCLSVCDTGTRMELLHQIAEWMYDPDREQIYILAGIAGKGKSTVSRTAASCASQLGALGASFFFCRDENGLNPAKTFFSTIAYQLAQYRRNFMNAIGDALELSPDTPNMALHIQLDALILEPLRALCQNRADPTVIVIDALDECEKTESKEILRLLLQKMYLLPSVKVLITTRPDPHIDNTVKAPSHPTRHCYEDIARFDADQDIRLFLRQRLSIDNVKMVLPTLQPMWGVRDEDVDVLVRSTGSLFIVAATSVLFILDDITNDPRERTSTLLQKFRNSGPTTDNPYHLLDSLYNQILDTAIPQSLPTMMEHFRSIVGAIIVLHEPLTCLGLKKLLGIQENHLDTILRLLISVINSTSRTEPLRVYHASFPDFIIDGERCERDKLVIHPTEHHRHIASLCFRVMQSDLQRNICDLQGSERYQKNCDIPNISERVKEKISPQLAYSCRYWANHLAKGDKIDDKLLTQLNDFVFIHFLHWLEVLSLIGKMSSAYEAIEHVRQMKIVSDSVFLWNFDLTACLD